MQNLKTEWKVIGSSGPTVDGRNIDPAMITSMAETYDTAFYAALMFPDHDRYWSPNFGKIESVRAVENEDGSVSLEAIIAPNENYVFANRNGQYLYSSMEILKDFPEPGKFYLGGCAPTDSPASTRTQEIRFNREDGKSVIFADAVGLNVNNGQHRTDTFFSRWFKTKAGHNDMNDADFKELKQQMSELKTQLSALKPDENKPSDPPKNPTTESLSAQLNQFSALVEKLSAALQAGDKPPATPQGPTLESLAAKIDALEAKFSAPPTAPETDQLSSLKKDLDKLTADFNKAIGEAAPGTTAARENGGDALDPKSFL